MIDIQPPDHPVHSWREFFIHIATIVLGLLIALGLEQTVEYVHHRRQIAETRKALRNERQLNAGDFVIEGEEMQRTIPIFAADIATFRYLKQHPGAPPSAWPSPIHGAVLTTFFADSAWKTAQEGQVLDLMPQQEVRRDASIYEELAILSSLERQRYDAMLQIRKAFIAEPDASRFTPAELDHEVDLLSDMILLCAQIWNVQSVVAHYSNDFRLAVKNNVYVNTLHWPELKTDDAALDKLIQQRTDLTAKVDQNTSK